METNYLVAHLGGLDDCVEQGFVQSAALRRKSNACSRRLIEDLPPCGGFVINVAGSLPPILKLFVADDQEIDGDIERANDWRTISANRSAGFSSTTMISKSLFGAASPLA